MLKFIRNINYGSNTPLLRSNLWFIPNYQTITLSSSTASTSQLKIGDENEKPKPVMVANDKTQNISRVLSQVFADDESNNVKNQFQTFINKMSVNDLLNLFEKGVLDKSSIILLAITLKRWILEKKIEATVYEKDSRFKELMKINTTIQKPYQLFVEPNTLELNKISQIEDTLSLTPSQCVQHLSGLALQHKRKKPFIQHLYTVINLNITSLQFKEIADVIYAMALLNYPDEMLLENMCKNISTNIDTTTQSPIIGSIVVSFGKLRYRNEELLNKISNWIVCRRKNSVRTRDACSFLVTLACLAFRPVNFDDFMEHLIKPLTITDMSSSLEWIDIVWALSVLNQVTPQHLESVLNDQFPSSLSASENTYGKKAKLKSINSTAQLLTPNYKGPFLNFESPLFTCENSRNKEKRLFIRAITDALANLFPSRDFFSVDFVDNSGLEIDIVFYYDKRKGPLPTISGAQDKNAIRSVGQLFKFAVVANSFQDYCLGDKNLIGSKLLQYQLLQAKGYEIIDISYEDFHSTHTLLKRITYMNNRIKSVVNKM